MRAVLVLVLAILSTAVSGQENENLEVEGAIQIGNSNDPSPDPGTIRWTGRDFEGWTGTEWVSLTYPFIPSQPTNEVTDDIVLLDSVQTYTVPSGKTLILSSFSIFPDPENPDSIWAQSFHFEVDGITFAGFGVNLLPFNYFHLGEDMILTSPNIIYGNGYLIDKTRDLFVHDLTASSYTVPGGKTLYITNDNIRFPAKIDDVPLNFITAVYSNQTLSIDHDGPGTFIGYLR